MATYQEQIEAARRKRVQSDVAEQSFDRMCGRIADVLLPYIEDGTLTHDKAADLMVKLVRAVLTLGEKRNGGDRQP